jgi:hypothetical protein
MAEAQECIKSAESTIEIAYAILIADLTNKNNLGVWYFSLYYGKQNKDPCRLESY